MTSQNDRSDYRSFKEIAYEFLLGALLGLGLTLVPFAIAKPVFTPWNITVIGLFVLVCGALAALFGKKFLHALMRFLESFPPVA